METHLNCKDCPFFQICLIFRKSIIDSGKIGTEVDWVDKILGEISAKRYRYATV